MDSVQSEWVQVLQCLPEHLQKMLEGSWVQLGIPINYVNTLLWRYKNMINVVIITLFELHMAFTGIIPDIY